MFTGKRLLSTALAILLCAAGTLEADDSTKAAAKQIDKGERVFNLAHSLHHVGGAFGPGLKNVAELAGIQDHVALGLVPVGNYHNFWDEAGDKYKVKQLLRDGKADVLTLVAMLPDRHDNGIDEIAKFAVEHQPEIRITLQSTWLICDDPKFRRPSGKVDWNARTGAELRHNHAEYFKCVTEQVQAVNKQHGKQVLYLVPVGQAAIVLREKIIAGQAPGLKTQAELFSDEHGHAREPLKTLLVYCHYAVIYRRNPVGLPMPALLLQAKNPAWDEKLNRLLQELAWNAVVAEPLSGVSGQP